jgi:hypothetical protein
VGVKVMVGVKIGVGEEVAVSVNVSVGSIGAIVTVWVKVGVVTGAQAVRSRAQKAKRKTQNPRFDLMRISGLKKHL